MEPEPLHPEPLRTTGIWLAAASLTLIAALLMHPPPPTETEAFMYLIAQEANTWVAVHWLAAAALSLFVVAGLTALSSRQVSGFVASSGWAFLVVGAFWTVFTAVAEATVIANIAAAGDLASFARWEAFAEGTSMGFAGLGLGIVAIAAAEARRRAPAVPRWSTYAAAAVAGASFSGWILGAGFGVRFGTPVWLVSSLLMSAWLAWYGINLARNAPPQHRGVDTRA